MKAQGLRNRQEWTDRRSGACVALAATANAKRTANAVIRLADSVCVCVYG